MNLVTYSKGPLSIWGMKDDFNPVQTIVNAKTVLVAIFIFAALAAAFYFYKVRYSGKSLAEQPVPPVIPQVQAQKKPNSDPLLFMRQQQYLKLIEQHPNDAKAYYDLAKTLAEGEEKKLLNGDVKTRQQLYLKSIECNPKFAHSYHALSVNLSDTDVVTLNDGSQMSKLELLQKCVELGLHLAPDYYYIAEHSPKGISLNGKQMTQRELYQSCIKYEPQYAAAYYQLGNGLTDDETIDLAGNIGMTNEHLWIKCIQVDSNFGAAYCKLGIFLERTKRLDTKLRDGSTMTKQQLFQKCLELDPNEGLAYKYLGLLLPNGRSVRLKNGSRLTKKEIALKGVEFNPNDAICYYNLGTTLATKEQILIDDEIYNKEALFQKSIWLDDKFILAWAALADTIPPNGSTFLNAASMTKQELYRQIIDLYENEPDKSLATTHAAADAYYHLAATLSADDPTPINLLNGKSMNQMELLQMCIDLNDKHSSAYRALAAILSEGGCIQLLNGDTMTKDELLKK